MASDFVPDEDVVEEPAAVAVGLVEADAQRREYSQVFVLFQKKNQSINKKETTKNGETVGFVSAKGGRPERRFRVDWPQRRWAECWPKSRRSTGRAVPTPCSTGAPSP